MMKRLATVCAILLLAASSALAQSRGQAHYWGTAAPATCSTGDTFIDTDAALGQSSFACTAPNIWVLQGGSMAIGGAVTSGTAGSILFVAAGPVLAQDNANFFWDGTTHALGINGHPANTALRVVAADTGSTGASIFYTESQDQIYPNGLTVVMQATNGVATNAGDVVGVFSKADKSFGAGTVDNLVGVWGQVASLAGAVTSATSLYGDAQGVQVAPTNLYGLRLADTTAGTNNYAIKTGLGQNSLGDRLTVKSNAAAVQKVTFTGAGLNDATSGGTYTGTSDLTYCVNIDGTGTPDTFSWGTAGSCTSGATTVAITGGAQALSLGVTITFAATTGHTVTNQWDFTAYAPIPLTIQNSSGTPVLKVTQTGGIITNELNVLGGTTDVSGNLIASVPYSALYHVDVALNCTTTSAAATVTPTIGWTDTGSQAQTLTLGSAVACTALGAASVGSISFNFRAKAGTAITYATTRVNTPTWDLSISLDQRSTQ